MANHFKSDYQTHTFPLKALDTIGNWEPLIVLNIASNGSPWSNVVFKKEAISHPKILRTWDLKPFIRHLNSAESTQFCASRVFFISLFSCNSTNWAKMFVVLLFYAYVGIHQVRKLVFDNYQRCPVPLKEHVATCISFEGLLVHIHDTALITASWGILSDGRRLLMRRELMESAKSSKRENRVSRNKLITNRKDYGTDRHNIWSLENSRTILLSTRLT